ncbi:MAG: CGNR zinc finger domain-containing protein [Gammaproteobacteria bacterium]
MNSIPLFPLLGESLSLDLANTRMHQDGTVADLLETPAELAAWLRLEAERLSWTGSVSTADWRAVCKLRSALEELFGAWHAHRPPNAVAVAAINHAQAAPSIRTRFIWTGREPRLAPLGARSQRSVLLCKLAADAVTLLTGPQAKRLRKCANPDCVLMFVATYPRRRWCSSALCGNRARVARHYRRHHDSD